MALEITPEPTPEERAAILEALAALVANGRAPSEWWRQGLREAVLGQAEPDGAFEPDA